MIVKGTLVLAIPTRDGLVVAADSKASVAGEVITGRKKLITLSGNVRTVFAITGRAMFYHRRPIEVPWSTWLDQMPPDCSGEATIRAVLQREGDVIVSDTLLSEIAESSARDFNSYFQRVTEIRETVKGGELCRSAIFQFDPDLRQSFVASYQIDCDANGVATTSQVRIRTFPLASPICLLRFGVLQFVDSHVFAWGSVGRNYLGSKFEKLWDAAKTVEERTAMQAVQIASGIIAAADLASLHLANAPAVGGVPSILLIDGDGPPRNITPSL